MSFVSVENLLFVFLFAFLIFRLFDIYLTYIIYTPPPNSGVREDGNGISVSSTKHSR